MDGWCPQFAPIDAARPERRLAIIREARRILGAKYRTKEPPFDQHRLDLARDLYATAPGWIAYQDQCQDATKANPDLDGIAFDLETPPEITRTRRG